MIAERFGRIIKISRSASGRVYRATLTIQLLGGAASVVAARLLGPSDRGNLAAIVAVMLVVIPIGSLGLDQAYVYFGARANGVADYRRLVFGSLPARFVASSLLLLLASSITDAITTAGLWIAVSVWAIAAHVADAVESWWQARQRWSRHSRYRVLLGLGPVVGAAMLLLEPQVAWYVRGLVAVLALGATLGLLALMLEGKSREEPTEAWDGHSSARSMWRYAGLAWPSVVANSLNRKADQVVLAVMVAPAELGYYVVAASIANLLPPIATAIASVAFPRLSRVSDALAYQESTRRYARRAFALLCGGAGVLGVGTLVGLEAVFGSEYAPSTYPALVLLGAAVGSGLSSLFGDFLRAADRPGIATRNEILGAIATVALLAKFGGRGIVAVSFVSLGAYWFTALLNLKSLRWLRKGST